MINIQLLKSTPESLPRLAEIWYEGLGKIWNPDASIDGCIERYGNHANDKKLPITFVALDNNKPIGMCSLREDDGIGTNYVPWLGSLVVDPSYQRRGVAKLLIDSVKEKACELGFTQLYLFTLDSKLNDYYNRLGWNIIGTDQYKTHPVTVMVQSLVKPN